MFQTDIHNAHLFLGKVRKTSLKIQLLYFLSNQDDFVTSREITTELNIKNPNQTQQLCRELQEDIRTCYKQGEFELIINKSHGTRLLRTHGDLKLLLNMYHYSELSYHILTDLFYENPIPVSEFCEKHFVSEATARRKVRQLNLNLKPFQLRITIGRQLTLVGSEENILAYYFLSNYLTYQSITNLAIPEERQILLTQAASTIVHHFQKPYMPFQIEMIALLYGVQRYRILKGWHLKAKPKSKKVGFPSFEKKPDICKSWSDSDWDYFVFILYLFNLYTPNKSFYQSTLSPRYNVVLSDWKRLFFYYFPNEISELPEIINDDLIRLFHFQEVFPRENYLFHVFPLLSLDELGQKYPLHLKRFEHFKKALIQMHPELDSHHFIVNSLLLTLDLTPIDLRKQMVHLYIECPLSASYIKHLQSSISERFHSSYRIKFVPDPLACDLIISTVKRFTTSTQSNLISVHPLLFENDYILIEQAIQRFFSYDTPDTLTDRIE